MNCVPGMTTEFFVEPTITTDSMKLITNNPKFEYVLLCNKVCGVAHYNMRMNLVIESPEAFRRWYKKQQYVFSREVVTPSVTDSVKMAESFKSNGKAVSKL